MPINKQLIYEALNKRPLCHGHLIAQKGLATEYCAMGALAMDVGATDSELKEMQDNYAGASGTLIWERYGNAITNKFGIESFTQFQSLMQANDAEPFATRRNKHVCETVEAMSGSEVNNILNSPSFCTESVDAET